MLLPIPGIGPWSVQMVLIFGLCRMDVLPVGDLGFRQGVRDLFGWNDKAPADELEALAEDVAAVPNRGDVVRLAEPADETAQR